MRRYERPHINEVWCGDSSVGPKLTDTDGKKHRIYVIALIDDASRFITGVDVFFNDNFVNLMSVMKSAISKYGRPKVFNFDNGKAYRNRQMELLAARIGSTLSYCQPYTPTGKAKIERWFRTLKDQWMASLDMRDFHVSAKYSSGFPKSSIPLKIVAETYLDYFTTITEDRLWQQLAKPAFRWRNRSGLSMNAAKAA